MNEAQIAWLHNHPFTINTLKSFCEKDTNTCRFMLVDTRSRSQVVTYSVSQKVLEHQDGHVEGVQAYLNQIFEHWYPHVPEGYFLVWLDDGVYDWQIPLIKDISVLTFSRKPGCMNALLIPDAAYMETMGYAVDLIAIRQQNQNIPWSERIPKLFWRGAAMARNMDIDAAFANIPFSKESEIGAKFHNHQLVGRLVPFSEFALYRWQIDIDGYSCSWMSMFRKLHMESVMLKVMGGDEQWYYNLLLPWKHYIPVAPDLSDLLEILDWLAHHDREAWEISHNARLMMSLIDYKTTQDDVKDLIRLLMVNNGDTAT